MSGPGAERETEGARSSRGGPSHPGVMGSMSGRVTGGAGAMWGGGAEGRIEGRAGGPGASRAGSGGVGAMSGPPLRTDAVAAAALGAVKGLVGRTDDFLGVGA